MARLIAGDKVYEVGALTLGEFRILKRDFGVERMDLLDPRDPDHMVGFIYIAERRKNPAVKLDDILDDIEQITEIRFELDEDEGEGDAPRPTEPPSPSPDSASGGAPATDAAGDVPATSD